VCHAHRCLGWGRGLGAAAFVAAVQLRGVQRCEPWWGGDPTLPTTTHQHQTLPKPTLTQAKELYQRLTPQKGAHALALPPSALTNPNPALSPPEPHPYHTQAKELYQRLTPQKGARPAASYSEGSKAE
jgi:hypothetical protein